MKKCYKTVLKAASFLMVITVMVSLHQMQLLLSVLDGPDLCRGVCFINPQHSVPG